MCYNLYRINSFTHIAMLKCGRTNRANRMMNNRLDGYMVLIISYF